MALFYLAAGGAIFALFGLYAAGLRRLWHDARTDLCRSGAGRRRLHALGAAAPRTLL